MAMGLPVAVVYGLFSIFGAKAAAILTALGLGTVVGYGRGFGVPVSVPVTAKVYWNKFKAWANEDSDASVQVLIDIFQAIMYGVSMVFVMVFFGVMILKFTGAANVSDIFTLPVVGDVIKAVADALSTGASAAGMGFLLVLMIPIVLFVQRMSGRITPGRD